MEKEEVETSLFADDMILHMGSPKNSTQNLLGIIHEYTTAAGYEIPAQNSVSFLYTNNELSER